MDPTAAAPVASAHVAQGERSRDQHPAASEWPVQLVLDEVWLRARRGLVQELERRGLWPERARYRRYMGAQRELGERLRQSLLVPAIGEADAALLGSETPFGPANQRVRDRVPVVLAFGHELGAALCDVVAADAGTGGAVAERCAMFNLGVSLFDVVCDSCPDLQPRLVAAFDERMLAELTQGLRPVRDFVRTADDEATPELRVLLKIIAAFFDLGPVHTDDPERLPSLLRRAYRAELAASHSEAWKQLGAFEIAQIKSMLPFAVIAEIVRGAAGLGEDASRLLTRLADDVGRVFWLTDDLVDAVPDFCGGAVNALLLDHSDGASADQGEPLRRALDLGRLEAAAEEVGARLADALDALTEARTDPVAIARMGDALMCYTRDWLQ
jgi:hypothetical protein